jgi:myo-inositol 2-dehydrogenase / D-chiro-inositol 1-dehydrogenase
MFRLGLVGAGRMGRVHLRALSASDSVRVVAVAEPTETARATLQDSGVQLHPDVHSMLQANNLDGVLIAAPSALHLPLVEQLADAGLPILCEKPCGTAADQARKAAATAERHGVTLQVAYWRRFVPPLQRLRQRILNGEFGALYCIVCYQWDGEPPSAIFNAESGGIFVDMGVHEFDQIRWLSGQEIVHLHAAIASVTADPESAQVLCTLSGGSTALVSLGRRMPAGDVCRVEVLGTRDAEECRFLWPPEGERVFLDALRYQAESFAAQVRGGPAGGATAADAVAALTAAEQAEAHR